LSDLEMEPERSSEPSAGSVAAQVRWRLDSISDPCSVANGTPMGLNEMGLIAAVQVDPDGNVVIHLRLTSPTCMMISYFTLQAQELVGQIAGVRTVEVLADQGLDWAPEMMSEDSKRRRRASLRARGIPIRS
jgi:metal-sulfur cluster biosynthetic enzyme